MNYVTNPITLRYQSKSTFLMTHEYATNSSPILPAFRRLRLRLRQMACAMLGDEEDADDALQDAFCRLWPRRGSIRNEDEAAALLTTTVRNIGIDTLRQRRRIPTGRYEENGMAPPWDDGDDQAERERLFVSVERLIAEKLSPTAREILKRKDFLGESYETIAENMEMHPTAVRMQLSRARKTIRDCYRAERNKS